MTSSNTHTSMTRSLSDLDPELAAAMAGELARERDTLEMIASENFVPRAVL
ncbi:serine hydroxymethyltransferase, partial [Nocardia pseudobrasiliensis]